MLASFKAVFFFFFWGGEDFFFLNCLKIMEIITIILVSRG